MYKKAVQIAAALRNAIAARDDTSNVFPDIINHHERFVAFTSDISYSVLRLFICFMHITKPYFCRQRTGGSKLCPCELYEGINHFRPDNEPRPAVRARSEFCLCT